MSRRKTPANPCKLRVLIEVLIASKQPQKPPHGDRAQELWEHTDKIDFLRHGKKQERIPGGHPVLSSKGEGGNTMIGKGAGRPTACGLICEYA